MSTASSPPIYEVLLEKKSRGKRSFFYKNWTIRTFKLQEQVLSYYEHDILKGKCDLKNSITSSLTQGEADKKPFAFQILFSSSNPSSSSSSSSRNLTTPSTTSGEKLILNAFSEEHRQQCIRLFNEAATNPNWVQPQAFPTPFSLSRYLSRSVSSNSSETKTEEGDNPSSPLKKQSSEEEETKKFQEVSESEDEEEKHRKELKDLGIQKFYEFITEKKGSLPPPSINSDESSTTPTPVVIDPRAFPKHGIRLTYLIELLNYCNSKTTFAGMTTTQVCEEVIKPFTVGKGLSFCEYLLTVNQSPHVIKANVFISHAWKYKFLDVIDAIVELYQRKEKSMDSVIIWFDLFSNNQHMAVSYEFEWWCNTFRSAIHEFNDTVMIFAPWNDPIPLTRAWCIWELYCTIDTKSKLEIAMSKKEYQAFLDDIKEDPTAVIHRMLATINSENSSAWIKADEERIKEAVRRTIGFNAMNELVFEKLRDWILWAAESESHAAEARGDSELDKVILQASLSDLYALQGKTETALLLAKDCLRRLREFGEEQALSALDMVGNLYYDQGNLRKHYLIMKKVMKLH